MKDIPSTPNSDPDQHEINPDCVSVCRIAWHNTLGAIVPPDRRAVDEDEKK